MAAVSLFDRLINVAKSKREGVPVEPFSFSACLAHPINSVPIDWTGYQRFHSKVFVDYERDHSHGWIMRHIMPN